MRNQSTTFSNYTETLDFPLLLLFITGIIFTYLRLIALVVEERASGIVENLENMGLRKYNYIVATMSFFSLF